MQRIFPYLRRVIDQMQRNHEEADLKIIGELFKKRVWLIVLVTLLCVGAAGVVSYILLPPVYEARTVVMLTQDNR
jgi:capsular polysaccharide biosynthesis protein